MLLNDYRVGCRVYSLIGDDSARNLRGRISTYVHMYRNPGFAPERVESVDAVVLQLRCS